MSTVSVQVYERFDEDMRPYTSIQGDLISENMHRHGLLKAILGFLGVADLNGVS